MIAMARASVTEALSLAPGEQWRWPAEMHQDGVDAASMARGRSFCALDAIRRKM